MMRFAGLLALAMFSWSALSSPYDVVIVGGRVMDPETGTDQVLNVGINGARIAVITQETIDGTRIVNASGKVVAPGFIDLHRHGNSPVAYKLALRDGVTTAMDLEFGTLGRRVGDWYEQREGRTQLNYGTASSHELARSLVLDSFEAFDVSEAHLSRAAGGSWARALPDKEELERILREIDAGLAAGAVGLGSTVGYMPGVSSRELYEAQRVAADRGRVSAIHTRHTPGTETEVSGGIQEVLANAAALGAPTLIMHFNNPGWELVQDLLLGMRAKGHNVWGEVYPYAAGSTSLNAVFLRPEIWEDKLGNRYEESLFDPQTKRFFTRDSYRAMMEEQPTRPVVLYKMPAREIPQWLRMEGITLGSDGMPTGPASGWDTPYDSLPNMHPRGAGAYSRALRLARENDIPLMHVLAAMSYRPAKHLGATGLVAMEQRGRVQEGKIADIVIFDSQTVTDNATYDRGWAPSTGIDYVLVSGVVTVAEGRVVEGVAAGVPVRFPSDSP